MPPINLEGLLEHEVAITNAQVAEMLANRQYRGYPNSAKDSQLTPAF